MNGEGAYGLMGIGCPCEELQTLGRLAGPGKDLLDSLQGKLLYATTNLTMNSKPPGDWFPLVNNTLVVSKGRLLGSATDYSEEADGIWLKANSVSPGWFKYDAGMVSTVNKADLPPLTADQKGQILEDIYIATAPGGEIVVGAKDVVDAAYESINKALKLSEMLVKALPWVLGAAAVGAGYYGYKVYVKPLLK